MGKRIQSVERALNIIEFLSRAGKALPLSEIAHTTGLHIATCHHLLATLESRGYVDHCMLTRFYSISKQVNLTASPSETPPA